MPRMLNAEKEANAWAEWGTKRGDDSDENICSVYNTFHWNRTAYRPDPFTHCIMANASSLAGYFSKLLTNKYVLYIVFALSLFYFLGYIMKGMYNSALFFILVAFVAHYFSKNMIVVLAVAMVSTSLFVAGRRGVFEGMENAGDAAGGDGAGAGTEESQMAKRPRLSSAMERAKNTHPDIAVVSDVLEKDPSKADELRNKIKERHSNQIAGEDDAENGGEPSATSEQPRAKGINGKLGSTPKLDYAATLSEAYDNLDKMLGQDGVKQLGKDTQKLMQQQKDLFSTMNQFMPILENAQSMLKSIDMNGLNKLTSMASSLGVKA